MAAILKIVSSLYLSHGTFYLDEI